MANELALKLRAETAEFKQGINEARTALRALRGEARNVGKGGRPISVSKEFIASLKDQKAASSAAGAAARALRDENNAGAAAAKKAAAETRAQTATIQQQAAAFRLAQMEARGATGAIHQHNSALGQAIKTGAQLAIVYGSLRMAQKALGAGIDYNATLEGARLAIAAVVSANEKITDAQGKQIVGVEKLRIAQAQTAEVMDRMKLTAIATGTPINVLVAGFQAAVAPAMAMGLSLKQTEDVVVGMTNAMKAMNIPLDQQRQEIQDILNADIDRNSHVAKNLQLNSAILGQWKEQGTLAQNLLRLLEDYNVAAGEFKNTWAGATSVMRGNFEALMGVMTKASFDKLKAEFKELADIFGSDDARNRAKLFGESLRDGLELAIPVAKFIANLLGRAGQTAGDAITLLSLPGKAAAAGGSALGRRLTVVDEYKSRLPALGLSAGEQQGIQALPAPFTFKDRRTYLGEVLESSTQMGSKLAGIDAKKLGRLGELFDVLKAMDSGGLPPSLGRGGVTIGKQDKDDNPAARAKLIEMGAKANREATLAALDGFAQQREAVRQNLALAEQAIQKEKAEAIKVGSDKKKANDAAWDAIVARRKQAANEIAAIDKDARDANKKSLDKQAKLAAKAPFGQDLYRQAIGDMPDESARLRKLAEDERDRVLAKYEKRDKARFRFGKADDKADDRAGRIAAKSTETGLRHRLDLLGIATGEKMAGAGLVGSPRAALEREIAIRKEAIDTEYALRTEASMELVGKEASKSIDLLHEAIDFKEKATADLLSYERIERMKIAKEEGEMRKQFAIAAAQTAGDLIAQAIRGGLSGGSLLRGAAGLAASAVGLIPGGQVAAAGIGIGGNILGALLDKGDSNKQEFNAYQEAVKAAEMQQLAAKQNLEAAENQKKAAILQVVASGKDIDDRIAMAKNAIAVELGSMTPMAAEEARIRMGIANEKDRFLGQSGPGSEAVAKSLVSGGRTTQSILSGATFYGVDKNPDGTPKTIYDASKTGAGPNMSAAIAAGSTKGAPATTAGNPLGVGGSAMGGGSGKIAGGTAFLPSDTPASGEFGDQIYGAGQATPKVETGVVKGTEVLDTGGEIAKQSGKFDELLALMLELNKLTAGKGTAQDPIVIIPKDRQGFSFAPRSFFFRTHQAPTPVANLGNNQAGRQRSTGAVY